MSDPKGALRSLAMHVLASKIRGLLDDYEVPSEIGEAVLMEVFATSMAARKVSLDSDEFHNHLSFMAGVHEVVAKLSKSKETNREYEKTSPEELEKLVSSSKERAQAIIDKLKEMSGAK